MKNRLPPGFRQEIPDTRTSRALGILNGLNVRTVCAQARCPNLTRCFKNREITFIILGDVCTRNCRFCAVRKSPDSHLTVDAGEPKRVAAAVKTLGLEYVVITSVTRDDLSDGGAGHFSETIGCVYNVNGCVKVEILIPDFKGRRASLKAVVAAGPSVIGHNLETVKRLYPRVKPDSDYGISLEVLRAIKELNPAMVTKSSLMLGIGEQQPELIAAMRDLREAGCDMLVLGQYLAPSPAHYPIRDFIREENFKTYRTIAVDLGFKAVSAEPLARSSYHAGKLYAEVSHA
jgi:lipoic acid synthetase